jgi:hypothetical protein
MTFVSRKIGRIGVWAPNRPRTLVYRHVTGRTNLERRMRIVGDLKSVTRVAVTRSYPRSRLSDDLRVGLQVDEASGEARGGSVVVRLCEETHRAPQGYLLVRRLQRAVRKVCRELEIPLNVIWFSFCDPASLELNRDTQEVVARYSYEITPLEKSYTSEGDTGRYANTNTYVFAFSVCRHRDEEQRS